MCAEVHSAIETEYSRHYARLHQFTDEYYAGMARSYRRFLRKYLPGDRDVRILDVGCGTGFLLNAAIEAGYANAEGIDVDRGQVRIGRERRLPIDLIAAEDVQGWLRARAGKFDVVLMIDVLEHIRKDGQLSMLRAVHAALAPGGRLICQVPNALFPFATYNRFIDWTHECLFSRESLAYVMENAGFEILQIEDGHDKPSPPRAFIANAIMGSVRAVLQAMFAGFWRLAILTWWGVGTVRHPIRANLIVIALKTADSREI